MRRVQPVLLFTCIYLGFCVSSCVAPEEKTSKPFSVSYQDSDVKNIYALQTGQQKDSLIVLLRHEDPVVRYAAARAFASYQDSSVVENLLALLADDNGKVRAMAAQAIGLIGSSKAESQLTGAFDGRDSARLYQEANGAILEATGRIGSMQSLRALSTISTYQRTDTLLLLGQARGIYRFAQRGMTAPEGTAAMIAYFTDAAMPFSVRLIAINYLHRATGLDLAPYAERLTGAWHSESNPQLRMALATALGKLNTSNARDLLIQSLQTEADYRVKCNMLRALQNFNYDDVHNVIIEFAKSGNPAIAEVAAQYFVVHGKEKDAARYKVTAEQCKSWVSKTRMAEAANIYMTSLLSSVKTTLHNEIQSGISKASDPYEKAAWLKALGAEIRNFELLSRYTHADYPFVVRTQAVQSLIDVTLDKNFENYFAGEDHLIRAQIGGYLLQAVRSGDPGMLALIAGAILNPKTGFKEYFREHHALLSDALSKLDLPAEMETYLELSKALREYNIQSPLLEDDKRAVKEIDWTILDKLGPSSKVNIITTEGNIEMSLFPDRAPQSVANFVQLVELGFYNGKAFHRVVPNFVVQTGCPRGDGYGSLDFTLRSELAGAYYDDEGYAGMASAGLHTEGTQFFITHCPTPHLDGRYTIFGRVTSGMDVVHRVGVGTAIKEINIVY